MKKINSVAIVGGTHGNELTGVYMVKHWQQNQLNLNYAELNIELMLANQQAISENKRYIEKDLNRCFKLNDLKDKNNDKIEQHLANKINQQLGPKGNARVDCIIDLHTSTANMKTNIVLIKMDEFHLKLAAYLKSVLKDVVITTESQLMNDHHFLCSIADKSILIEVGPIPQGTLDADCFSKTEQAIKASLDFIQAYNDNQFSENQLLETQLPELNDELIVYSYFSKLYFPQNQSGEIIATVHPDLILQDFNWIKKGQAIFKSFAGEDILYDGEDAVIAFVNEAAYYDQKIAMCLCQPLNYSLSQLAPISH